MKVFISDCEGPISKNDNAFEITSHFVPNGDKLFSLVSRYDDVLADVLRRSGYKAGNTLKLILPFLKAYEVTDEKIREFSAKTLSLVPSARETVRHIKELALTFIVSTSYEHYIKVLCEALNFPFENTCCTRMSLGKYKIMRKEKSHIMKIADEIARMPLFDIPSHSKSFSDLSTNAREAVERLDEIFWEEISEMNIGKIYSEVSPIGGAEKAEAVRRIVNDLRLNLADVIYIGDSITDEEALKVVKSGGGLTVSFNGNQYAVRNAEVAVLSETSVITAIVADIFIRFGKKEALELVEKWDTKQWENSLVANDLQHLLFKSRRDGLPRMEIVTEENIEILARESSKFRKKVRGEAAGRLG